MALTASGSSGSPRALAAPRSRVIVRITCATCVESCLQMGFLKARVRGPLRECESILNDLLALGRARCLQQHPSYMPDKDHTETRRMQPDPYPKGEEDISFVGQPIYHTSKDVLEGYFKDFLTTWAESSMDGDLDGWEPEDYQREDLVLLEYPRACPWTHCKLTPVWSTKHRQTCDNYFLYTVPRSPMPNELPPAEPTREELLDLDSFPRDFEQQEHDFLFDTYACEVRAAAQFFVF